MFAPDSNRQQSQGSGSRRVFLFTCVSVIAGVAFWRFRTQSALANQKRTLASVPPETVDIVDFSDAGVRAGVVHVLKIVKTDDEWRDQLGRGAYEITRKGDTEFAFSGQYWNLEEKGLFRCVCCATALFSSDTKFESGTGWPSFWQPIAEENVVKTVDGSLMEVRTAVSCRLCDAHLGHVFDDGPAPTGLRYCMNSASMRFVKLG